MSTRAVIGRVLLDQCIGSPFVIFMVFCATIATRDLSTLSNIVFEEEFRMKMFTTWITGLQYWPIVHGFNFKFIPLLHQPLFAHFASVYWNAVLSYYAFQKSVNS